MKNIIIILFFITLRVSAQDKFVYDKSGLTDFVVLEFDSISKEVLYQKTLFWIKETYKNPDEVLKMTIENEKLRFDGFKENAICLKSLNTVVCSGVNYSVEVEFKSNRLRFNPIELKNSGWDYLNNPDPLYNKNEEVKKMYNTYPDSLANVFNELLNSLKNYILSDKKEDEW